MKTANTITSSMKKDGILLAIASIGRRGAILDRDIQSTALAIAAHIQEHREVSLAVKLHNAMPNGSRKVALIHWMIKFSAVKVNLDKASKADFPLLFDKEATIDLEEGAKLAWFDCKKEKTLSAEFNFETELEAFQKKVKAWVKAGKISEQDPAVAAIIATKATPVTVADLVGK